MLNVLIRRVLIAIPVLIVGANLIKKNVRLATTIKTGIAINTLLIKTLSINFLVSL